MYRRIPCAPPRSIARAASLYARGCNLGVGNACTLLAISAASGVGVTVDLQRAHALMERACDLRDALGCRYGHRRGAGREFSMRAAAR